MKLFLMFALPIMMFFGGENTKGKEFWNCDISFVAYRACIEYGEEYDICPELLMAIIETESRGNPTAEGGGCKGLMQISERWHKDRMERLGVTDLFDEKGNILVGTDYLAELFAEYDDPAIVLMVYNGDSRAFEDGYVSDYARDILERSAELENMRRREEERCIYHRFGAE